VEVTVEVMVDVTVDVTLDDSLAEGVDVAVVLGKPACSVVAVEFVVVVAASPRSKLFINVSIANATTAKLQSPPVVPFLRRPGSSASVRGFTAANTAIGHSWHFVEPHSLLFSVCPPEKSLVALIISIAIPSSDKMAIARRCLVGGAKISLENGLVRLKFEVSLRGAMTTRGTRSSSLLLQMEAPSEQKRKSASVQCSARNTHTGCVEVAGACRPGVVGLSRPVGGLRGLIGSSSVGTQLKLGQVCSP
jgi:hypothetical protein